jgi:DNA-binding PadR family transcriptional regulator
MRKLNDRLDLAKIVLTELSKENLSRTELESRTVRKKGTHATFEGIMRYLIQEGYVEKNTLKHRSNYKITEKGAKLLEAI